MLLLLAAGAVLWAQPAYDYYLTGNPANVERKTRPGLMLAGGGRDQDAAFRWFLERAGGGDIVVLRGSGSDGYNDYLMNIGAADSVESIVIREPEAARDGFVVETIRRAEGLFFAGGDQWNYIRLWRGTPVLDAIHEVVKRGAPVGGTSAGLAILGEYSFGAEFDSARSKEALADPYDKRIALVRDFLRLPHLGALITDSHFAARDRMGRLVAFLARIRADGWSNEVRGVGVDERTVVLVDECGQAEVRGEGAAYFLAARGKPPACAPGRPLTSGEMPVYRIRQGGRFDLGAWRGEGGAAYVLSAVDGALKADGGVY